MMTGQGPRTTGEGEAPAATSELALRVVSAVVLVVVALALDVAGVWPFLCLVIAGALIGAWEWGRLVRGEAFDAAFFVHAGTVTVAAVLAAAGQPLLALAALGAGFLVMVLVSAAGSTIRWSLFGILYIGLPAVALVFLRNDPTYGWQAIVYLFTIVWMTDTAAYFAGRKLQGPKLWPRVSPKKTWSGCIAGLLAGALVGAFWGAILPGTSVLAMALVAAGLALVAELGDLAESAAKRTFGHKDMSNLIPGHGGMLDRVDSLIFASLAAASLALLRDAEAPGTALMVWP